MVAFQQPVPRSRFGLPIVSPRRTFPGAFFVPNTTGSLAGGLQTVQAASETVVFPSPLKRYLRLDFFDSAILLPCPLAFSSEDLPWGIFCPGSTKLFSFLKVS